MKEVALGADIGGSHITCQLFDTELNSAIKSAKSRIAVNSRASKNEIINNWISAIREACKNHPLSSLAGIGFAMPGPFDYEKGVAWFKGVQKFESLYGVNIREEIQQKLHLNAGFPVRFLNDATCFAIGEAWMGEASKFKRIIALTMGTGFGTTFIENGLPVSGKYGIPEDGFLYHIPFQNSIADDYFSTRWFLKEYETNSGKPASGVKELYERTNFDPIAAELFKVFGENLGNFLIPWVKTFNADCLVFGGNISRSFTLFKEQIGNAFLKKSLNPAFYQSNMEEKAALFGSAKLCDNNFHSKLA